MNKERNDFLNTGIYKYKEAHDVYWHFRDEIKSILISTISDRENYGKLIVSADSIFFKNWGNGLYLTSRIGGEINDRKFSVGIGIDWGYDNRKGPIPFAWIENENRKYVKLRGANKWLYTRYNKDQQLGYFKDFKIEEIDSIFNDLLDELIPFLDGLADVEQD
ncbi:MAG: hypothetical protein KAG64_01460 [Bacteroidales bacterium]|nr:hypothetical protein [Bacteroidales bacterium]